MCPNNQHHKTAPLAERVRAILASKNLTLHQVSQTTETLYGKSSPFFLPTSFHLAKNMGLSVAKPDRHLCRLAAVRADDVVHHARPPVPVRRPTCRAALGATPGLVLETPRLVELLLPRREEELPTAVTARQRPIHEAHRLASLEWFSRSEAAAVLPTYPLRVADRDFNSPNRTLENWS